MDQGGRKHRPFFIGALVSVDGPAYSRHKTPCVDSLCRSKAQMDGLRVVLEPEQTISERISCLRFRGLAGYYERFIY